MDDKKNDNERKLGPRFVSLIYVFNVGLKFEWFQIKFFLIFIIHDDFSC